MTAGASKAFNYCVAVSFWWHLFLGRRCGGFKSMVCHPLKVGL